MSICLEKTHRKSQKPLSPRSAAVFIVIFRLRVVLGGVTVTHRVGKVLKEWIYRGLEGTEECKWSTVYATITVGTEIIGVAWALLDAPLSWTFPSLANKGNYRSKPVRYQDNKRNTSRVSLVVLISPAFPRLYCTSDGGLLQILQYELHAIF